MSLEKIIEEIKRAPANSSIYIGVDSERFSKGNGQIFARITSVVVIHLGSRNGCKVIGDVTTERLYNERIDKPRYRLMLEVYKAAELYLQISEATGRTDIEVHLDINPKEAAGSSIVAKEAIGYIRGVCGVTPRLKPMAFAASYAADQFIGKMRPN